MTTQQNDNSTGVEIQDLQPQPVLSIRGTIPTERLGETMGERLQALRDHLQQQGAGPAGPPFVRYHTFRDTETDFETGVPVAEPVPGEGWITAGELPGGTAVTTWHLGPHDKLGDAYARISGWLKEQGREPEGPGWEVYYWIDLSHDLDPSSWDASAWRTQLVQPVR